MIIIKNKEINKKNIIPAETCCEGTPRQALTVNVVIIQLVAMLGVNGNRFLQCL